MYSYLVANVTFVRSDIPGLLKVNYKKVIVYNAAHKPKIIPLNLISVFI